VDIPTLPHPGFPTDLQAQTMVLLSLAQGTSIVTENVFENRFVVVDELNRLGAGISTSGHHAVVEGPRSLSGTVVEAPDLRGGAALVTAGLMHLFGFQISMTVLAAVLTIIGYSVNDTIVIFDRIREDLKLYRNKTFLEICNQAINETLSRTLLTNFLTFVSVAFLLFLGGQSLRDFSVAMFIGMISGTYSTVYIATPVVLLWYRGKRPDLGTTAKIG
ncbi:MAG: protein translocase subunit SecF, partial [bacterium]